MNDFNLRGFQSSVSSTADVLTRCSTALDVLRNRILDTPDNWDLETLEDLVDNSVLTLNSEYLKTLSANTKTGSYEYSNKQMSKEVERRLAKAQESIEDVTAVRNIYGAPVEQDYRCPSNLLANNIPAYKAFCHTLCKISDPNAAVPDDQLIKYLIQSNVSQSNELGNDGDLTIEESVTIPICPMSGKPLHNAVRNLSCKHCVSEEYSTQIIGKTCPSRGCNAKIETALLIRDPFMDIETRIWCRTEDQKREAETQHMETV